MLRAAGVTPKHLIEWYEDHPIDDDLALLRVTESDPPPALARPRT